MLPQLADYEALMAIFASAMRFRASGGPDIVIIERAISTCCCAVR
jgi:hypothetical protein